MSESHRIDYLETPSRDLEKTKKFFAGLFGWHFKDYGPEYAAYDDGSTKGGFYKSDKVSLTGAGGSLIVLYAENLENCQEQVKRHGGSIVKEIFSFPGGRRFQFTEPGGSEFAVWSDK